jgi:hypothetical protein
MSTAFLTNAAEVQDIATAYAANKVITLSMATSVDVGCNPPMPGACFLDHIELVGAGSGIPSPTTLTAVLAWDAAGNDIFTGEASGTFIPAVTAAGTVCIGLQVQSWIRFPDAPTTRLIYLFVKVNQGFLTVPIGGARLVWTTDYVNQS